MPRNAIHDRRRVTLEECSALWGVDARSLGRKLCDTGIAPVDYVDRFGNPTEMVLPDAELFARYRVGDVIRVVIDNAMFTPLIDAA